MNHIKKLIPYLVILVVFVPINIQCQNSSSKKVSNEDLMIATREIIDAAGNCALITLDEKAIPMVRIMDPFPPEGDFTVWFGTNSKSRKVKHIRNNPNVTLYYQDKDASGYVVIHGTAQIVDDQNEKQIRWKKAWEAFYPNNREGYLLIKVTPEWMEILSTTRGILGDATTWETPVVRFD